MFTMLMNNIEKIYYLNNSGDKLKGIKFVYNKDKWITEIDGILSDKTVPIRKYEYYNDSKIQYIRDYKNFLSNGRITFKEIMNMMVLTE